jgi:hypothetical protein
MQAAVPPSGLMVQSVPVGQLKNVLLVGSQYCVPLLEQLGAVQLMPQLDAPGVQPLVHVEAVSAWLAQV